MSRRAICRCTAACLLACGLVHPSLARADTPAGARGANAEELFEDARRDLRAGRTADACPKLEESQRLDPGVGTLLHLGECYERLGRTASAWAAFREVEPLAQARGDHDRARLAAERIAALAPRLSRLVIEIPAASRTPGLRIELDGTLLGAASWGVAMPVNPGAHTLRVAESDRAERSFVIATDPAKTTRWILTAPKGPADEPALPDAQAAPPTPPASTQAKRAGSRSTVLIAGAATGGVLFAAGGFFGLRALTDWRSSRSSCDADNACDPPGLAAIDRAKTSATVATALLATGAVASAATLVLYVKSPRGPQIAVGARSLSLTLGWP